MNDPMDRPRSSAAERISARYGQPRAGTSADVTRTSVIDLTSPDGTAPGPAPSAGTPDLAPDGVDGAGGAPGGPESEHATALIPLDLPYGEPGQETGADPAGDLPPLVDRSRTWMLAVLAVLGAVGAVALMLLPAAVGELVTAPSRRGFFAMLLLSAGLAAILGLTRWLDHVLSERLASAHAEEITARVLADRDQDPDVVRRAIHALRHLREGTAHFYARLLPAVLVLLGAAIALARVHASLPFVAAAPLLLLGAVAVGVAGTRASAARAERHARYALTMSVAEAVADREGAAGGAGDGRVVPVHAHVVRPGEDVERDEGEELLGDTLDPVDEDDLVAARERTSVLLVQDRSGTGPSGLDLPDGVGVALRDLADANARSADAGGTLRAAGLLAALVALVAVAVTGTTAGVGTGPLVGALVVTTAVVAIAADVAEGVRYLSASREARRTIARALPRGRA